MTKLALFFIHGMWSYSAVWDRMRSLLEAEGFATHAGKLPGHEGEPGDLTRVGLVDYVAALETQVARLPETPVIIGHSMGALLAQLLAVKVKPRALILLSTAPSSGILALAPSAMRTTWPIMRNWGYWRQATHLPREAALYGIYNNVQVVEAEDEVSKLVPDSGRALFQIAMPFLDSSKGSFVDYGRLNMPSLVVCGIDDRVTPISVSRATARKLSGPVTYHELDGFGHWIVGEQGSPRVAREISKFLA